VGLLAPTADLYLDFKQASSIFSRVLAPVAFPPSVYQGSFFPTSSPTHVIGGVFDDGYSSRDKVES
jgi:hypothetical protein